MDWSMGREAALDALAVVFPVDCAGCGGPDRALCAPCRARMSPLPSPIRTVLAGDLLVTSAFPYDGVVRRVIIAFKEQGRTDVGRALAPALAASVATAVRGECELVAVPSGRGARRRRGYEPLRLLTGHANLRSTPRALAVTRRTARQKSLGVEGRRLNAQGSLRARADLAGRRFVLLDDVVTTGSTLVEAARAIKAAGGEVVGAATLAATPRRSGRAL